MEPRAYLRAFQAQFPVFLSAKVKAQRFVRRTLRKPFEADFRFLKHWSFGDDDLALDVGANRGQSIDAIRMMVPNVRIMSFEPNQLIADALDDLFAHDDAVEIDRRGLAEYCNSRLLYTPFYNGFMYDGLASFDETEATSWLNAETLAGFDPKNLHVEAHECEVARLDLLALEPDFIKIDVQGYEAQVLLGGKYTIEKTRPLIMLENNQEGDAVLTQWGWMRFAYAGDQVIANEMGELNTFYVHPSAIDRITNPQFRFALRDS